MATDPERTPVIVGTGQINDRPDDPTQGLDPLGLMAAALRQADADAGGGWLARCNTLAVVSQIAWPQLNPLDAKLADTLGMAGARTAQTALPNGDSPIRLLNEAANRIAAGDAAVCAVVGGEALRTAGAIKAAQQGDAGEKPNALKTAAHRRHTGYPQSYGLVLPVDIYPLYENALRAHCGQPLEEGQAESGALWAGMSAVAASNPHAWLQKAMSAEDVVAPGERNRAIAFPYTKFQVANAAVNQGAGLIVTSLAEARKAGIPAARLIYVGRGAAAHEDADFLARAHYHGSAGLEVSIRRALALNAMEPGDCDHVELYSCFPCVPKMARRVLDWPLERPITVFGGLTFGGGPIGNYMSHAVACMTERLRDGGGRGLLFANGGYATHNHTIVLGSEPLGKLPEPFDYQSEADQLRGAVPARDETFRSATAEADARVESYTVFYDRDGEPQRGVVVAQTPAGARTLANVPGSDGDAIRWLTSGDQEPVGCAGRVIDGSDGLARWERHG